MAVSKHDGVPFGLDIHCKTIFVQSSLFFGLLAFDTVVGHGLFLDPLVEASVSPNAPLLPLIVGYPPAVL